MSKSMIKRVKTRPIKFTTGINPHAYGSVLVEYGQTKIHVTASVEDSVPSFLKGSGRGWITAEYSMLPAATHTRHRREISKLSGRTQEIQRLIGRSLRSVMDLKKLGERSIIIDCDVLVADGGTRTSSISGGFIALKLAIDRLLREDTIKSSPIKEALAAISVGLDKDKKIIADLNYEEDYRCETDMNIVMAQSGHFIEIQGTAEGEPFSREQLVALLDCAHTAIQEVFKEQQRALLTL